MLVFTIDSKPIPQPRQRHRIAKINGKHTSVNYLPASDPVHAFKAIARAACRQAYDGAPLTGPLSVGFEFVFARTKATTYKTKPMLTRPHYGKPDCDNLMKAVLDALNGVLWADDAQVCEWSGLKRIGDGYEKPRVILTVAEIPPRTASAHAGG